MDESILDNTEILGDENIDIVNPDNILGEDTSNVSQQLAHDLLQELQTLSENNSENDSENVSENDEVVVNEPITQNDYSQQLSDIYNQVGVLNDNVVAISQSCDSIANTLETLPQDIRVQLDDIISFQYLTLSLYIGLIVAIIFFMGLKK